MKRILLWTIVAAIVVTIFVAYRHHAGSRLDVAPDAQRAIDKARKR